MGRGGELAVTLCHLENGVIDKSFKVIPPHQTTINCCSTHTKNNSRESFDNLDYGVNDLFASHLWGKDEFEMVLLTSFVYTYFG